MIQINKWNIDDLIEKNRYMTQEMTKLLGLGWPLAKGWRHRLLGKTYSAEQWQKIQGLKESIKKDPRLMRRASRRNGIKNTGDLFGDLL
jgi:hypothetical protein